MDDRSLYTDMAAAAATTAAEQFLIETWQAILHIFPIGVEDNFIELGGTSMLAIRLVARIEKETGIRMSAEQVLESSTLAEIALQLDQSAVP